MAQTSSIPLGLLFGEQAGDFRHQIGLTTGSPRLAWMNRRIFLSNGRREQTRVTIEVFEVR